MKKIRLLKSLLAITLVIALLVPPLSNYMRFPSVYAAGTFTDASLTISDSRAAATNVTYDFALTATSSAAIKQIDIYFCTAPSGACSAPTGFNTGTPTLDSDTISGTDRTVSKISGQNNTARVVVTTPATQDPTDFTMSFTGLTNQSTTNASIYARVTSYSDTGTTVLDDIVVASAILTAESIYVTADVQSTFTFAVAAVNSSDTVNGETTTITTTEATIPFGTLTAATPSVGAHDLTVVTNATNGYAVTVKALADPPLVDGSENIDIFTGTNASPSTWSEPAGTASSVNTGFFGYTTEDGELGTGTTGRFTATGGNKWAGFSTSPEELIYRATEIGGSGETTRVGWQTEVNSYQPPGTYTGTIVLVATPTY